MALLVVPDCRRRLPVEALDARQRAALVRLLAEKGPAALEAWLKHEELRDPGIRARLERHRVRLERSARAERERRMADIEGRRTAAQSGWEMRMNAQMRREEEFRQRIARAAGTPVLQFSDLTLVSDALQHGAAGTAQAPRRPSLWRRFLAHILLWWARVQVSLRPSLLASRQLLVGQDTIDLAAVARDRPELLVQAARRARRRPFWVRVSSWLRRLFGREDAFADLRTMVEDEAREARRRQLLLSKETLAQAEAGLAGLHGETVRDADQRRRELAELEAAQRQADDDAARHAAEDPYRSLTEEVLGELQEAGMVDTAGQPTQRLLERFSSMLLDEAVRGAAEGGPASPGTYTGGEGEYERGAMASAHEIGAMELVETVVRARTRHPHVRHIQDDDVIVHRETRSARAHVVVVFDHSNSMEEHGRLEAAKKVCLVLHRALREDDPDHRIDLVAMGTSVRRVDLAACWAATPSGFTNHGAALREARRLLESGDADRRLVYLITDGLPEARTLPDGRDVADRADACLPDAVAAAKQLRRMGDVRLLILQLEASDPRYLDAARKIAAAGGGRVVALDPKELARTLLVDLRATTRTPAT